MKTVLLRPEHIDPLAQALYTEWHDFAPWSSVDKIRAYYETCLQGSGLPVAFAAGDGHGGHHHSEVCPGAIAGVVEYGAGTYIALTYSEGSLDVPRPVIWRDDITIILGVQDIERMNAIWPGQGYGIVEGGSQLLLGG